MLHKATDLIGSKIDGDDGRVGEVEDVYFDDERWGVRYLVVSTGAWLNRRMVLISPASVRREKSTDDRLRVALTREQVRNSPPMDSDKPVSRRYEMAHATYYRYPYYWLGPMLWGGAAYPATAYVPTVAPGEAGAGGMGDASDGDAQRQAAQAEYEAAEQSHLRSSSELIGYAVQASDGDVGTVADFVIDDSEWGVRGVVVDTRKWLPGGDVMVPVDLVDGVDWSSSRMTVKMDREAVRQCPVVS